MNNEARSALQVSGLSKTFTGVRVLDGVSFDVFPGEVHALLGQNGSGKSTLIKCLAGVYRPDHGAEISIAGKPTRPGFPPSGARQLGLAFVHQDLGLIPDMTVAENLALGVGFTTRGGLISWRKQRSLAEQAIDIFDLAVRPDELIRDVPVTMRTLLAIARALQTRTGPNSSELACLILDEPTASLPDNDADILFAALDRVKAQGVGIVYVSHRLDEIFRIADRATVLRNGVKTGSYDIAALDKRALVEIIIGQKPPTTSSSAATSRPSSAALPDVLRVSNVSGIRIKDLSLTVRAGEIVGVAGLGGSGRSELARLIFGAQERRSGTVQVADTTLPAGSVSAAVEAGVGLVPEDRRRDGCVMSMTVTENMTLVHPPTLTSGFLDLRREKRKVRDSILEFDIRPTDPNTVIGTMSGGNQQKVVLAKWLEVNPKLLILDEPVQGVDIGAKADIYRSLRSASEQGTALLMIDSDFDNLAELCDRVLVIRDGHVAEELVGAQVTSAAMSRATFGIADTHSMLTTEFDEGDR
ncbi:sugar ABC transporter ATP-binding protein [Lacisediminihabitans profunda]|nr:sugar ABC transporter ATP-binding protein [Lacisediminihabitans profunda]